MLLVDHNFFLNPLINARILQRLYNAKISNRHGIIFNEVYYAETLTTAGNTVKPPNNKFSKSKVNMSHFQGQLRNERRLRAEHEVRNRKANTRSSINWW